MNAVVGRWILAGMLVPVSLPAQTIKLKTASLRLYEQSSAGGVLEPEKRVYTFYFNSLRTRYIGLEATLEFDPAPALSQLSVACQMTAPDGKVSNGIWKIGVRIQSGATRAVGANTMFGASREGWQTGLYKVNCSAGEPIGETAFQMSPGPSLLLDTEIRLSQVRFFLTGSQIPPSSARSYSNRFSAEEAARIGIELSFLHPNLSKSGEFPIDCYYLQTIGYVLGTMNLSYALEPGRTGGSVAKGLGYEQPGHWSKGEYLAICQIHGRPISVDRFTIW